MANSKYYYLVAPLVGTGKQTDSFTYHFEGKVATGSLVVVPFGKKTVHGVVIASTQKPKFKTKAISKVIEASPLPEYLIEVANWIRDFYATSLPQVFQTMLPARPQVFTEKPAPTESKPPAKIALNTQQAAAVKQILEEKSKPAVLHGITGSGKTHVYIELARQALKIGKSSIILVPEISLTPQVEKQFKTIFGKRVLVTHSGLKDTERRKIWQLALKSEEPIIVIGPRSAIFTPLKNLGLIVIDEAHDSSYKQDQNPRYHTTMVAGKLAGLAGAKLVLGSATPSATDIFLARQGRMQLVEMPKSVHKASTVTPQVIDMRNSANLTKSSYVSKALLTALKETLDSRKQSLLFINRRGSARIGICNSCGWTASCPRCGIPLTLHTDKSKLLCHWCGYSQSIPTRCPECEQVDIRYLGMGSQRIENEIAQFLPKARIERLDRDSADKRSPGEFLKRLYDGEIDILVGTQMVAKGLDIPSIETVGIISADSMLYMPDFTANERTFQLLYQVSGRAGRRKGVKNRTIIQTYSPNHPTILSAAKRDYWEFMDQELEERQLLNYPPYVYLLKLTIRRKTQKGAQEAAQKLANEINKKYKIRNTKYDLVGPAPAFRETLRGQYYWQIIIKSKDRKFLADIAWQVPGDWTIDLDPADLL